MVYILLGTGFEEMEAVCPCDMLRRAGVDVMTVGVNGKIVYTEGSDARILESAARLKPFARDLFGVIAITDEHTRLHGVYAKAQPHHKTGIHSFFAAGLGVKIVFAVKNDR